MRFTVLLAALFFSVASFAQNFSVGFYNTENLFDTIDDPQKQDEEFLPSAKGAWNSARYNAKLANISKVMLEMNGGKGPDAIGFCEVENKKVLEDLAAQRSLSKLGYAVVHYESPDERGIDVGLLYKKRSFKVERSGYLRVSFPFDPKVKTRDVLWVKGTAGKESLCLLVNHWPSRRGGTEGSEPKRMYVAGLVRSFCDSVLKADANVKIVIMGDLNDTPSDKSIAEVLQAAGDSLSAGKKTLCDLGGPLAAAGKGTHYYRGEKSILDQFIVSHNVVNGKGLSCSWNGMTIVEREWLMEKHPKSGEVQPFRTYAGPKYLGGYSDHLPVELLLKK